MRALITGAAGFVGRGLVQDFHEKGWEVVGLHRGEEVPFPGSARLRWRRMDLARDVPDLSGVDLLIHTAAHTPVRQDQSPEPYLASNGSATLNLAQALQRHPPRLCVALSTLSVYGRIPGPVLTEETPFDGPGLYGASKYLGELILRESAQACPLALLRLPGVVGRGAFDPWLGRTLLKAMRHEAVDIYNPDSAFNNLVDVPELVRLIRFLMDAPPSEPFLANVGAAEPLSVREVVERVLAATGSRSQMRVAADPRSSFCISTSRLEAIGFGPETTRAILERTLEANLGALP